MSMSVIVDSNMLIADFCLTKSFMTMVLDITSTIDDAVLVIPQIVLDEVENHMRLKIVSAFKEITKAHNALKQMGSPNLFTLEDLASVEMTSVQNFMSNLENFSPIFVPYPSVSHRETVRRIFEQKKPFSTSEKGYRDFLFWQSVLEFAKDRNGEMIIATKNHHDFCVPDQRTLHPDLEQDLIARSLDPSRFSVVESAEDLRLPIPRGEEGSPLQVSQFLGTDIGELIATEFPLYRYEVSADQADALEELGELTIDLVEDVHDVKRVWGLETKGGEKILRVLCTASCELTGFLHKSDYFLDVTDDIYIADENWNAHMMAVAIGRTCEMDLTITMSRGEHVEVEVNDLTFSRSLDSASACDGMG